MTSFSKRSCLMWRSFVQMPRACFIGQPYRARPDCPRPETTTIFDAQTPHFKKPESKYSAEKDRQHSPGEEPAAKKALTTASLRSTALHTSSDTIRRWGAYKTTHSDLGRSRCTRRPVLGSRTLRVRFHTATPRYRSLWSITERADGAHDG